MADALIEWIEPVRARREEYAAEPERCARDSRRGFAKRLAGVARKTMARVREAVFGWEKTQLNLAADQACRKNRRGSEALTWPRPTKFTSKPTTARWTCCSI